MDKKELRLEFEYAVRPYKNEHGDCYELTVKPSGDMKSLFPVNFERALQSSAKMPLHSSFCIAAMALKEGAQMRAQAQGMDVRFSEQAYFKDKDGNETAVKPATINLH